MEHRSSAPPARNARRLGLSRALDAPSRGLLDRAPDVRAVRLGASLEPARTGASVRRPGELWTRPHRSARLDGTWAHAALRIDGPPGPDCRSADRLAPRAHGNVGPPRVARAPPRLRRGD